MLYLLHALIIFLFISIPLFALHLCLFFSLIPISFFILIILACMPLLSLLFLYAVFAPTPTLLTITLFVTILEYVLLYLVYQANEWAKLCPRTIQQVLNFEPYIYLKCNRSFIGLLNNLRLLKS